MPGKVKTGYVYDPKFLEHNRAGHPENRKRLEAVIRELESNNLLTSLTKIQPRSISRTELELCHSESYLNLVEKTRGEGEKNLDPDTYVNSSSFDSASLAAGGLLELTDNSIKR